MAIPGDDPRREVLREEAAAWLARLRGPATEEDHAAFQAWYMTDPDHAAAYDGILESWEITGTAGVTSTGQMRPHAARRRRHAAAAAIAATVAIVLLAFAAYGAGFAVHDPARPVAFASAVEGIRTVELADGSRVTLDAGSLLEAEFSADERRVRLRRGRARFAVAHESARPFVVEAGAGLVIAHGTLFDVAIDGERVTVSLLEGSVEVRAAVPGSAPASASSRMLTPGQRVVLDAGEVLAPPIRLSEPDTRWPNGMLSFENAPLGEVIAAANRYGASRIVLADPALERLRFTGTFKAAETDNLAEMLAATFDLKLSRKDRSTFVLAPLDASVTAGQQKIPG